jgi:hypothetical protein
VAKAKLTENLTEEEIGKGLNAQEYRYWGTTRGQEKCRSTKSSTLALKPLALGGTTVVSRTRNDIAIGVIDFFSNNNVHTYLKYRIQTSGEGSNLLSIKKQELSIFLTDVLNVHLGTRGKGDVDTIALPQLNRVAADGNLDRSTSGGTSVVAGPLDEVGINVGALSGVREGSGGREDGGEDVEWGVDRGRAASVALIDDLLAVLGSRCDDMRPFVLLVFIREMPNCTEMRGLVNLCPDKDCGKENANLV